MLDVYKLVIVCILSTIEGLTEFLPISSTGHIILVSRLLNHTDNFIEIVPVVVQLGVVLSIIIMFWERLHDMGIVYIVRLFVKKPYCYYSKEGYIDFHHILIGTCPAIVLGMVLYEKVRLILEPIYVMYGLVVGGMFLLFGEISILNRAFNTANVEQITYWRAFLIGCFQCLAFWPGFSRSGATIGGGLIVGLNRSVASEFSFFLAIPIICGSAILTIYHHRFDISMEDSALLFVGCFVAFIMSFFTARIFFKMIQNISLVPFVIYRFLLAGCIYWNLIE